ncbi:dihydroxyacetone kinase [Flagelloscypha sp. PMI_526]|nr:dihydroxyacetone kinase [Flagelloscypha sp. PMI_526]
MIAPGCRYRQSASHHFFQSPLCRKDSLRLASLSPLAMNKHVVNDPAHLVVDSLKGLVKCDPALALDEESRVNYLKDANPSLVSIISGGGSGHEPSHSGWVTPGLLTGAVTGNVFASPNTNQIKRGIELVNKDAGTLIVIMNYTGDILHFGLAKEYTMANNARGPVRFLVVADDVAVPRSQNQIVGRRGLAGTVLVYKVAGAYAQRGASIDQVEDIAKLVNERIGTIGVGLGHCHVPGTGIPEHGLAEDEIEVGMGIHNEPGLFRLRPLPPRSELIKKMLDLVIDTSDKERAYVPFQLDGGDKVVLMVNNLGGISELELGAIVSESASYLESKNISVEKALTGTYMTSLNMPGFSLTLLLLPRSNEKVVISAADILKAIDERTPGSKWAGGVEQLAASSVAGLVKSSNISAASGVAGQRKNEASLPVADPAKFLSALKVAMDNLIKLEPDITEFDTVAGDGDCGLTLKGGAEAILSSIASGQLNGTDAIATTLVVAEIVEEAMGGTSGALYSIFFNGLASSLTAAAKAGAKTLDASVLSKSLSEALASLYVYTRARPPTRTLINPLAAFISAFESAPTDFKAAVKAGNDAAEETRKLKGTAGRAAYVSGDELQKHAVPDPGAWGVKGVLDGFATVF